MNVIEKAILNHAKSLLFEYAKDELQRIKEQLEKKNEKTLFDVLNTGIMIDVDKIKKHAINHLQKKIENRAKKETL